MFEQELAKAGAARPSSIEGADELSTLYGFVNELCPWYFNSERFLGRDKEKLEEVRRKKAGTIETYLEFWGY